MYKKLIGKASKAIQFLSQGFYKERENLLIGEINNGLEFFDFEE